MINLDIEKLKQIIEPDELQKALLIVDMQKYLMSIESDNIEEIRDAIINSNYLNEDFLIKRFIENVFICCKYRGHRVLDYVTLVYEIYRHPMMEKREYLKKCIFKIHQSGCRQPWRLLFIWGCTHLYDPDEIYSYIQAYLHKYESINHEQMNLFAYFAPYIEKYDTPIFDSILAKMRLLKAQMNLPRMYHPFLDQFDELRANNWQQHKSAVSDGFTSDCLIYSLRHDEYDLFLQFAKEKDFDPNQRINESLLIRYPALMNRMTILEWASFHGARRTFDYLLSHGADPKLTDDIGLNLMHFSVLGGHHYMITKCQELGFDFSEDVVSLVAEMYRFDLFFYLYDQKVVKFDEPFLTTGTVFHRCATANNIFLMLFCIEKGVDVNVGDKFHLTPLYYAVKNVSLDAVNLLLSHSGIRWDATDKFNDTPLHEAARAGDVEVFNLILNHKDGILNVVDKDGRTPLFYAIAESKTEVVELLLSREDIDINHVDQNGMCPLFVACERGRFDVFKIILKMNENPLFERIEFNRPRNDGNTMLHYCTLCNKVDFLNELLKQNEVDPNVVNGDEDMPIHIAAKLGFVECVKLIVDNENADVNAKARYGFTPLHTAVKAAQRDVVEVLLECDRVDTELTSNSGITAEEYASQLGFDDIAEVFEEAKRT